MLVDNTEIIQRFIDINTMFDQLAKCKANSEAKCLSY